MIDDNKEDKTASSQILITGMPPELKSQFKILCYQNDVSMSEVAVALLKAYVERKVDVYPDRVAPGK